MYPVELGIPFLGFRVFPAYRRLLPNAVKRARLRLKRLAAAYESGEFPIRKVSESVTAWIAQAAHGNTYG